MKIITAKYDFDNWFNFDKHFQSVWNGIRKGDVIDLDSLESKHVQLYIERCFDFFTDVNLITIFFQSEKGRLAKVKGIAKKQRLQYKTVRAAIKTCRVEM